MFRVLLLVGLMVPVTVAAAPDLRALTPPDPQAATPVWIEVDDLQVFSIREQEEVFELGGRLTMRWIDPRQAYDPQAAGAYRLEFQGKAAEDQLDQLWWPDVEFVDAVGSRERVGINLTMDADGEISYRERFLVEIKQDFHLRDFPYDQHRISFALEPFTYGSQAVRFVADESALGTASWEPTEWVVDDPELEVSDGVGHLCRAAGDAETGPFAGSCAETDACPEGGACEDVLGFSRMTVSMDIARVSSHYNGNIILPMILIVLIAGAVFWMDLDRTHLGDRLNLAFTSLLTVVAFDFVTSSSLPKLWYSTALDRVVTAGYIFLALNIALSVLIDRLDGAGERQPRRGRRLNRILRWGFPLAYLGCVAFLILGAG